MKFIKPTYVIEDDISRDVILRKIEKAGRVCYKSEGSITADSAEKFIKKIVQSGHESVIEHVSVTVRVICDRGISHEIVRHRIASYSQESTRYCNYAKDKFGNEISIIEPCFWKQGKDKDEEKRKVWEEGMAEIEKTYFKLIELGASPQEARSILPNGLKTEIVMTLNLRSWRNFFRLRTARGAHPQIREIAIPLLKDFKTSIPVIFDDIVVEP